MKKSITKNNTLQYLFNILFILYSGYVTSQNVLIKGVVVNNKNTLIEDVNIIAFPTLKKATVSHTTSNSEGKFELLLNSKSSYKISISHINYKDTTLTLNNFLKPNISKIVLQKNDISLNEVVINYKYKPVKRSKDTISYHISNFINGNELKMEDVVKKLPGLTINNNAIKIHGKPVNKVLVEGKTFFGGSSQLALENLPAEVIDKIEIIKNYKESKLLKNLKQKNEIALNVSLKEDRRKFLFGDIKTGYGLNNNYLIHPTIFKYAPKFNLSYIGDANNFNNNVISFSDLLNLKGGISNLLNNNSAIKRLASFSINSEDRKESKIKFSAINFHQEFSSNFTLQGLFIANNTIFSGFSEKEMLFNQTNRNETITDDKNNKTTSIIFNFETTYKPTLNEEIKYSLGYFNSNKKPNNSLISTTNNKLQTLVQNQNTHSINLSQNIDYYNKISKSNTLGVALNFKSDKTNYNTNWNSSTPFLQDFYPLQKTKEYNIYQYQKNEFNNLHFLAKNYWIASNHHHLFFNLGINTKTEKIRINEGQFLNNKKEINHFLGNNLNRKLIDLYSGIGIKSKFGKLEVKLEALYHKFIESITQNNNKINNNNAFIEPKFDATFHLSPSNMFEFSYNYSANYSQTENYLKNKRIKSYNHTFIGNPNLLSEKFHHFNLSYSNFNDLFLIDIGIEMFLNTSLVNTEITYKNIERKTTVKMLFLPEKTISLNGEFEKVLKNSNLNFSYSIDWIKNNQTINGINSYYKAIDYFFNLKWNKKITKKAHLTTGLKSTINTTLSNEKKSFSENEFYLDFDAHFLQNWTLKTNLSFKYISDYLNQKSSYTTPNIYINYKKQNSRFIYGIILENILNNGIIIQNSYSPFFTTTQKSYIIPKNMLFSITYKF